MAFDGPLEARANATHWARLLELALPALDFALPPAPSGDGRPGWTLGGGTALALRIGHRLSDDIDLFVSGRSLKLFTPAQNPAAKRISARFEWPGHYLKFTTDIGEIDFLSAPLQTVPGYTVEQFKARAIALETCDEVIVKKIRYRSGRFTARDCFDLAAVARARPAIIKTIAVETPDALDRLSVVIRTRIGASPKSVEASVRPSGSFTDLAATALQEALAVVEAAQALVAAPLGPSGDLRGSSRDDFGS